VLLLVTIIFNTNDYFFVYYHFRGSEIKNNFTNPNEREMGTIILNQQFISLVK
jgi:hypothetical protein